MKIVLDAGHGPETAGKRTPDGSMREYQFNSAVAKYVQEILSAYPVSILMVHDDARDVPLQERTNKANAWGADVYISIHANAFGSDGWNNAQGIETFVYQAQGEAYTLACEIQTQLVRETGRMNRSVKTGTFWVLRRTKMTSILVECGFMTNQEEAALLKTEEYRRKCAKAIANGIIKIYKLIPQQPKVEPQTPQVEKPLEPIEKPKEEPKVEQWKIDAHKLMEELGIYTKDRHKPEEPVDKGFLAAVIQNTLKHLGKL